jgi:chemotaxis protein MotB
MDYDDEAPAGAPDWVVTYGDLMSLLLTFFIMLFSMSEVQSDERFCAMQSSLQRAFGSYSASNSFMSDTFTDAEGPSASGSRHGRVKRSRLGRRGAIDDASAGENEKVATVRPGQHWTIGGHVLFVENSAELSADELRNLKGIAGRLAGKPMKIAVRGHTGRQPPSLKTPQVDDWDLAYGRSRAVALALVALGIERDRVELDVIGRSEPAYTGLDESQFVQNARVEVFLLDRYAPQFDPNAPAPEASPAAPTTSNSGPSPD